MDNWLVILALILSAIGSMATFGQMIYAKFADKRANKQEILQDNEKLQEVESIITNCKMSSNDKFAELNTKIEVMKTENMARQQAVVTENKTLYKYIDMKFNNLEQNINTKIDNIISLINKLEVRK